MSIIPSGAGRRVLIVEDEFLLVLAMEEAFVEHGFSIVGPVAEVGEAARLAAESEIDAAVLNIRLRDGLVFPAVRPLMERGIPFVFVSSEAIAAPDWMPEAPRFKKTVRMDLVVETVVQLITRRPASGVPDLGAPA